MCHLKNIFSCECYKMMKKKITVNCNYFRYDSIRKPGPYQCCTFVSRIEGRWEHINDLWNTTRTYDWTLHLSRSSFTIYITRQIHCEKSRVIEFFWARSALPCFVWLHVTPLHECPSPNLGKPKARIQACYNNMMQPVGDNWKHVELQSAENMSTTCWL